MNYYGYLRLGVNMLVSIHGLGIKLGGLGILFFYF